LQLLVFFSQICQNDRNFYSYVEMPLRCRSSEPGDFNVVVDASLLDVPGHDPVLVAVFQTLDENSDEVSIVGTV